MKIALAGNPNSGKTTMYNALTGQSEEIGNWAGVTVCEKSHLIKKTYTGKKSVILVDLPGAYSMSPFTSEESITSSYVKNNSPDVIINIVDATNLSRSLFFTTQLLELGIPIVVALNKSDINKKRNTEINARTLEEVLGCPVIETSSIKRNGLKTLVKTALEHKGAYIRAPFRAEYLDINDKAQIASIDKIRFEYVNKIVSKVSASGNLVQRKALHDKIDAIITSRWVGIPVFALVMWLVFEISEVWVGPFIADYLVTWLEKFKVYIGGLLTSASPFLSSLLIDGIIGALIALIGFLPLIMVMYFLLALLEDSGYMSRVAVVLDPIFKKVGLSGKSVIVFVMSLGCAVPGIMASRTIRNERERRASAMLAPLMPCGAKIPLIALFAGSFFDNSGFISTLMYFIGIFIIIVCALLVNKITGNASKTSYFIIELPEYKIPSFINAFKAMLKRAREYIIKAATIILLCNTAVQIMQSFTWHLEYIDYSNVNEADTSILASIASPFAYILVPIMGVYAWQLAAAAITGFIAKENVVTAIALCYGITNMINADYEAIGGVASVASTIGITSVGALAYLIFNLFSPPCFAAIGAMKSEMKSGKWFWGALALQLAVGYITAYLVYTVGTLITSPKSLKLLPAMFGFFAVIIIVEIISAIIYNTNKKSKIQSLARR